MKQLIFYLILIVTAGCLERTVAPLPTSNTLSDKIRTVWADRDRQVAALAEQVATSTLSDDDHKLLWNSNYKKLADTCDDKVRDLIVESLKQTDRKTTWLEVKKAYTR